MGEFGGGTERLMGGTGNHGRILILSKVSEVRTGYDLIWTCFLLQGLSLTEDRTRMLSIHPAFLNTMETGQ